MGHDSFIWDITHSYGTWLIHMCAGHAEEAHDAFMYDMTCALTHSYGTWLIHTCAGHAEEAHDAFIYDMTCALTYSYGTWLIHMWHDSFIWDMTHSYGTWLIHMCAGHAEEDMSGDSAGQDWGWLLATSCCLLQCVAVCCSVLQCVAVCCSVLQCVAVCCSMLQCDAVCCSLATYTTVPWLYWIWAGDELCCCSVLQSVVACCRCDVVLCFVVMSYVEMSCRSWPLLQRSPVKSHSDSNRSPQEQSTHATYFWSVLTIGSIVALWLFPCIGSLFWHVS